MIEMNANKKTLLAAALIVIFAGSFALMAFPNAALPAANISSNGKILFSQAVGQKAPDFSLESIDGKIVKLSDYKGKNVVLFFNEGSMCYPACWDQMAAFANDERFNNNDVQAFSVLVDTKTEWQKIIAQVPKLEGAKILFDTSKSASESYDVLFLQSSMHRGSFPGHTYFIIDKDGIIRYAFDDIQMAVRNDKLASEMAKLA